MSPPRKTAAELVFPAPGFGHSVVVSLSHSGKWEWMQSWEGHVPEAAPGLDPHRIALSAVISAAKHKAASPGQNANYDSDTLRAVGPAAPTGNPA